MNEKPCANCGCMLAEGHYPLCDECDDAQFTQEEEKNMTASELIERLKCCPPDSLVRYTDMNEAAWDDGYIIVEDVVVELDRHPDTGVAQEFVTVL